MQKTTKRFTAIWVTFLFLLQSLALMFIASPTVAFSGNFSDMSQLVTALEKRGVSCPGKDSLGRLQRSCYRDLALTLWPSAKVANRQAKKNINLLQSIDYYEECEFIVVGNALISNSSSISVASLLRDLKPKVYLCS